MGISPALRTTVSDGDTGHEADHGAIAAFLNGLFALATGTPPAIAGTGSAGTANTAARGDHTHAGTSLGTATPLASSKSPAAGTATGAAHEDHVHPTREPVPADHGFLTYTDHPVRIQQTSVISPSGNLTLARVKAGAGLTVANLWAGCTAVGTTLTNCYMVVYSTAGVLLGQSAEMSASLMSGTIVNGKAFAMTAASAGSLTFNPGDEFLVGVLVNGTGTGPSWWRTATNNSAQNVNLAAPNYRFMSVAGPNTTPPANIATPLATSSSTSAYWFGVS